VVILLFRFIQENCFLLVKLFLFPLADYFPASSTPPIKQFQRQWSNVNRSTRSIKFHGCSNTISSLETMSLNSDGAVSRC